MNIATIIIGLIASALVVLKMVGNTAELYQGPTLLLVVVGGIAILLTAYPLREVLKVFAIFKSVFVGKAASPPLLIKRASELAQVAVEEGIVAIETSLVKDDDSFLSGGLRLATDGTEPALIMGNRTAVH
tara:strand:+ start:244 stop:633 length:390 start_codon:yes stop_codon:yes gene_type:complete